MKMTRLEKLDYFITHNYAWPGGYPQMAIMADNEFVCHKCVVENESIIRSAIAEPKSNIEWQLEEVAVNWEDDSIFCANCSARIESAYGDAEDSE
jgi:DNA-directed RNA polymerase subunit RPC12/RpoP